MYYIDYLKIQNCIKNFLIRCIDNQNINGIIVFSIKKYFFII